MDMFAPVGGQILPFDWEVGDQVDAGEALISIRPLQLLAANDGIIRSLLAVVGDKAEAVAQQFGALCYIDRTDVMRVRASTDKAYDKPENRAIYVGESLRVYNGKDSDPLYAVGTVISISGEDYIVEIPSDVFDLEDDVKLYRGEDGAYRSGDKVGEGEVERAPLIPVVGEGTIARIEVADGQRVRRGDALLTLDAADAVYDQSAETEVTAARAGAVSALYVQKGQRVIKDQLLMTVEPLDKLEFQVDVDELDITSVQAGGAMQVKVDGLDGAIVQATVDKIDPLGVSVLDTTKYAVTLSIQSPPAGLMPGMRVTAYWG
jgi:biotin carboxyl carrier protein